MRRAEPVDALVRIEALVLDGDERVLHMLGYLVAVDPNAVFAALDGSELLIIPV